MTTRWATDEERFIGCANYRIRCYLYLLLEDAGGEITFDFDRLSAVPTGAIFHDLAPGVGDAILRIGGPKPRGKPSVS